MLHIRWRDITTAEQESFEQRRGEQKQVHERVLGADAKATTARAKQSGENDEGEGEGVRGSEERNADIHGFATCSAHSAPGARPFAGFPPGTGASPRNAVRSHR